MLEFINHNQGLVGLGVFWAVIAAFFVCFFTCLWVFNDDSLTITLREYLLTLVACILWPAFVIGACAYCTCEWLWNKSWGVIKNAVKQVCCTPSGVWRCICRMPSRVWQCTRWAKLNAQRLEEEFASRSDVVLVSELLEDIDEEDEDEEDQEPGFLRDDFLEDSELDWDDDDEEWYDDYYDDETTNEIFDSIISTPAASEESIEPTQQNPFP